jgi:hypothetical protein
MVIELLFQQGQVGLVGYLVTFISRRSTFKMTYDIFRDLPESGPIWIEAVQGLEDARARLVKLLETRPGDYFVYDPIAAKIVVATVA